MVLALVHDSAIVTYDRFPAHPVLNVALFVTILLYSDRWNSN